MTPIRADRDRGEHGVRAIAGKLIVASKVSLDFPKIKRVSTTANAALALSHA
jgi:hypothetical protein